jgi:hypothetical protein
MIHNLFMIRSLVFILYVWVKTHYSNPFGGIFGSSIITCIVWLFQKHDTFNFGHQSWFLGRTIIIFIKLTLCNYLNKNNKFHKLYWNIHEYMYNIHWYTRATTLLDCINFKASLIIKIINFNEIEKMAHLTMFVIFYVNTCKLQWFTFVTKHWFFPWVSFTQNHMVINISLYILIKIWI